MSRTCQIRGCSDPVNPGTEVEFGTPFNRKSIFVCDDHLEAILSGLYRIGPRNELQAVPAQEA